MFPVISSKTWISFWWHNLSTHAVCNRKMDDQRITGKSYLLPDNELNCCYSFVLASSTFSAFISISATTHSSTSDRQFNNQKRGFSPPDRAQCQCQDAEDCNLQLVINPDKILGVYQVQKDGNNAQLTNQETTVQVCSAHRESLCLGEEQRQQKQLEV